MLPSRIFITKCWKLLTEAIKINSPEIRDGVYKTKRKKIKTSSAYNIYIKILLPTVMLLTGRFIQTLFR